MNQLKSILLSLFIAGAVFSGNAQSTTQNVEIKVSENKIEVYYFHYTRRCATCNAVESESKKALETLYADKVKSGSITFQSINLDEENSKGIAEKLKVSEQSLLIVKGDEQINLTTEGFMFARTNPEKLQTKIKAEIDKLL